MEELERISNVCWRFYKLGEERPVIYGVGLVLERGERAPLEVLSNLSKLTRDRGEDKRCFVSADCQRSVDSL